MKLKKDDYVITPKRNINLDYILTIKISIFIINNLRVNSKFRGLLSLFIKYFTHRNLF